MEPGTINIYTRVWTTNELSTFNYKQHAYCNFAYLTQKMSTDGNNTKQKRINLII